MIEQPTKETLTDAMNWKPIRPLITYTSNADAFCQLKAQLFSLKQQSISSTGESVKKMKRVLNAASKCFLNLLNKPRKLCEVLGSPIHTIIPFSPDSSKTCPLTKNSSDKKFS